MFLSVHLLSKLLYKQIELISINSELSRFLFGLSMLFYLVNIKPVYHDMRHQTACNQATIKVSNVPFTLNYQNDVWPFVLLLIVIRLHCRKLLPVRRVRCQMSRDIELRFITGRGPNYFLSEWIETNRVWVTTATSRVEETLFHNH